MEKRDKAIPPPTVEDKRKCIEDCVAYAEDGSIASEKSQRCGPLGDLWRKISLTDIYANTGDNAVAMAFAEDARKFAGFLPVTDYNNIIRPFQADICDQLRKGFSDGQSNSERESCDFGWLYAGDTDDGGHHQILAWPRKPFVVEASASSRLMFGSEYITGPTGHRQAIRGISLCKMVNVPHH